MRKMRVIFGALALLSVTLFLSYCGKKDKSSENTHDHSHHHHGEASPNRGTAKSPARVAMDNIGDVHVHVDYAAPSVRERVVWGGLVPYDQVWATGAHMATNISFSGPVIFGGKMVDAGKYGLFTIPGPETWTVILNKNYNQHLADDYDQKEDILRVEVIPYENDHAEQLEFFVEAGESNTGSLVFSWEKLQWKVDISTP
ncbi:MAG: DUF2911 domain-containing protein [Cyclobacteriaceae bacterium]|nr:DUF2911 domain-containing protein [Cyclobacteriaceae bacterium]